MNLRHDNVCDSAGPAVSAFQKRVRGEETVLRDHICKEMNPLNLERCRCIPKNQPGADWRVLQQIVEKDPSRTNFQASFLVTLDFRTSNCSRPLCVK